MWTIRSSRSHLLKISSTQCQTQLLKCQRQPMSGIVTTLQEKIERVISDGPTTTTTANNNNFPSMALDTNTHTTGTTAKDILLKAVANMENKNTSNDKETKKPRSLKNRKGKLLRKLQQRVAQHKNRPSVIQPFMISSKCNVQTPVVTVDETRNDLDDTWNDLDPTLKYERIYPTTVTPVATLAHGLERTLFKPGVHLLKNLQSNHHYFTPFLENITQPDEFDYDAFQPYRTASKDKDLIGMAKEQKARYVGSTSSLSGILSHIYFNVSNHRPVDISCLSQGFDEQPNTHTRGSRAPRTILLRWKDGVYAVDADKAFDTGDTILSHLGKSMEKVLTMKPDEYTRYLKKNSSTLTEEERNLPEAFAYGRIGDVLLRSQLDCYHRSLTRRTFDLKTRATMPIRLDIPHYQDYYNYQLEQSHGIHYSFEREYYDMMRSAFLKYSFQVRIGHMDGIMVTYHNTNKIFGFQYISRSEMDSRLFGTSKMGDEAFKHCLDLMQTIFNKATRKYPKQTLRMTFDASLPTGNHMRIYVEPVSEEEEKSMDNSDADDDTTTTPTTSFADITMNDPMFGPMNDQLTMYRLYTTSYLNGKKIEGPVSMNKESDTWDVCYKMEEETSIPNDTISTFFRRVRYRQATIFLPQSDESPKFLMPFKSKRRQHRKDDDDNDNDNDDKEAKKLTLEILHESNEQEESLPTTASSSSSSSST